MYRPSPLEMVIELVEIGRRGPTLLVELQGGEVNQSSKGKQPVVA
jgi:hypothetical protein